MNNLEIFVGHVYFFFPSQRFFVDTSVSNSTYFSSVFLLSCYSRCVKPKLVQSLFGVLLFGAALHYFPIVNPALVGNSYILPCTYYVLITVVYGLFLLVVITCSKAKHVEVFCLNVVRQVVTRILM